MSIPKKLVLVVDDEAELLIVVRRILELEGYRVITADNGKTTLHLVEQQMPDLVILDIMLPGMDGFTVCKRIREFSQTPIIMLTAKDEVEDKLKGFELGADDYLPKPFSRKELLARVKAVLHRSQAIVALPTSAVFRSGQLEIDFSRRRISRASEEITLTPMECRLLEEFVFNRGKVLKYTYLISSP